MFCDASCVFPVIRVLVLSDEGKITGMDGTPISKGHVDDDYTSDVEGILPFPSQCLAVTPLPLAELKRNKESRSSLDSDLIKDMLSKVGLSASEPSTMVFWRNAQANVNGYFAGDSFKKRWTCFFPPTASMPDAVYSPEVIYQAPRAGWA